MPTPPRNTRRPMTDADLAKPHFSAVCIFCAHWQAGDGHHCTAYPGDGPEIPDAVWSGQNFHMMHIAEPDDHDVTFTLHPETSVDTLSEPMRAAYLARQGESDSTP